MLYHVYFFLFTSFTISFRIYEFDNSRQKSALLIFISRYLRAYDVYNTYYSKKMTNAHQLKYNIMSVRIVLLKRDRTNYSDEHSTFCTICFWQT